MDNHYEKESSVKDWQLDEGIVLSIFRNQESYQFIRLQEDLQGANFK